MYGSSGKPRAQHFGLPPRAEQIGLWHQHGEIGLRNPRDERIGPENAVQRVGERASRHAPDRPDCDQGQGDLVSGIVGQGGDEPRAMLFEPVLIEQAGGGVALGAFDQPCRGVGNDQREAGHGHEERGDAAARH